MTEHDEQSHAESEAHRQELIAEVESRTAERARSKRRLLPGMAVIGIWMLVRAIFGVFGVVNQSANYGNSGNYAVLTICTLVVIGVFGMFALRRWGWALVLGGCFLSILIYSFAATHDYRFLLQVVVHLIFFLYLVRTEVRERLR